MNVRTIVWVTTTFPAQHRWQGAPDDVAYLRNYHRHLFHVKLGVEVKRLDREVEFIQLKQKVDEYITRMYKDQELEVSCEMIAVDLLGRFSAAYCTVSEDGENGATVCRRTDE